MPESIAHPCGAVGKECRALAFGGKSDGDALAGGGEPVGIAAGEGAAIHARGEFEEAKPANIGGNF